MSKPEVLEKLPMNVNEVKVALENIKKIDPDAELNFRAQKTFEYAQELSKLSPKKSEELLKKLIGLEIPRVKEQHLHKLIDLMPSTDKQTKLILSSNHLTVSAENVKKLTGVIGEYLTKKK